ncbi:hypothetical protein KSP39_PZI007994 [Platanthera zijinensis]|uniref:Hydroxyproline-rich glycoprotein family protein n=1 Tax=Platanthera zijinensis TaxID=2320716 RepID=A0AAP0G8J7_9ASPA
MAEQDQPAIKKQTSDLPAQKKILSNFLYKAILFAIFIALLPLFPSHNSTSTSPTLLSRTWELLHLVLVGVAVSYGLFSQRNADPDPDKDIDAAALKADSPHSYVSRLLQISPVFDEDSTAGETKLETWSSQYRGPDPVVVESKPLLLPVRNLMKSRIQNPDSLGVLPSPIPWKSRSRLGTMDVEDEDPTIAASSPPPSVYAGYFSPEMRGNTSEDYIGGKNLHGAAPPAPPPPPPPPFNHASLFSERKEMKKSIKDELKDLRIKGREGFFKHSSPKSLRTVEKPPDLLQQKNPTETKKTGTTTTKKKKVEFMEKMIVMSDDSETEKGSDSCADEDGENSSTESRSEAKENEVDKKADEFIAKFREQIRLQRIESIKKSSKHRAVKNNNVAK